MLNILLLILGTTFAHRGGRSCREEIVDVDTQLSDLTKLLVPFSGAASEGDETTEEVATVMLDTGRRTLQASDSSTTCVMRGLSRSWPHEDASSPLARRLLWGRRKQTVKFDVDNQVFGAISAKKGRRRNPSYTCYDDGSVQFFYKRGEVTVPATQRRELGRNHDETEADAYPFATVVLTQTNSMTEGEDPVSFDMSMECRPWYRMEDDDETCTLRGLRCKDGEYTYFDDNHDEEDEDFWGMKCSSETDFHSEWEECSAVPSL